MKVLLDASRTQRFLAYIVDYLLISFITSFIASFIFVAIGFSTDNMNTVYNNLFQSMLDVYNGSSSDMDTMLSYFYEYIELAAIELGVMIPIYLVLVIIYLVIMPKFVKWQTFGRALGRCRVVSMDGSKLSLKQLLLRELLGSFLIYFVVGGPLALASAIVAYVSNRSLVDRMSKAKLVNSTEVYIPVDNNDDMIYNKPKDDFINAEVKEVKEDSHQNDDSDDEYMVF